MQWYDYIEKLDLQKMYSSLYEIANRIWKDDSQLFLEYDIRENFHKGDMIAKKMNRDIEALIQKFKHVRQSILDILPQSKLAKRIENYNEVSTLEKMKKMAYYFAGIKEAIKQVEMLAALDKEMKEDEDSDHRGQAIVLLKEIVGFCGLSIKEMEIAARDLELGVKWSVKKRRGSSMRNDRYNRIAARIIESADKKLEEMTEMELMDAGRNHATGVENVVRELANRALEQVKEKSPNDEMKLKEKKSKTDKAMMDVARGMAKMIKIMTGLVKPVRAPKEESVEPTEEPIEDTGDVSGEDQIPEEEKV